MSRSIVICRKSKEDFSTLGWKYFGGKLIPERESEALDEELIAMIRGASERYAAQMEKFQLHQGLDEAFRLIQRANKYIDETMPWKLAKEEDKKPRLAAVMYNLLEALRVSLILLTPFIPESCGKAFDQIGADESARTWDAACEYGVLPADVAHARLRA